MLVITLICFGVLTAQRTAVTFMPPLDLPFLGAFIPYPGATPAQVEQEIAIPAEGEFGTLPSLRQIYTNSSSDGCFVSLNFESGTDMTTALGEVRDRIERLRMVLPEESDQIFVRHFSLESIPIMQVALSGKGDYDAFAQRIDEKVLPRLLRIEGVAEINVWGWRQQDYNINFDQQSLLSRNLSLYDVINTLNTGNVDVGVGQLMDGNKEYAIRAEAKLDSIADYIQLPLANGARLGEVATGSLREDEEDSHFSIDGQRQMFMIVTKESNANTAKTCEAVMAELERILAEPEMEGAQKFVFFNQGDIITGALNGLKKASIYGGCMALLVLFAFLRRIRPTIVVALAIPGSLVAAFVFLYAVGMTLNLITMMSLIIAVGMVVDNSIVVIENIYRLRAKGLDRFESAKQGASEVAMAIIAATLTTAVVFVPVFYIDSGEMSVLMRHFAVPVTVSLVASLVIALTVIPLAVSRFKINETSPWSRLLNRLHWVHTMDDSEAPSKPSRLRFLNPVYVLRNGYELFLRRGMKHRFVSLLIVAGFVYLTVQVPMKRMGFQEMPSSDGRMIEIDVDFDANYNMEMASEVFETMESIIKPLHETLGVKHSFKQYTARGGEMNLFLINDEDMDSTWEAFPYSSEEVMDILWYVLPDNAPGVEFSVSTGGMGGGGGGGGGRGGGSAQKRVSARLEGDDTQTLDGYAKRFLALLDDLPGLTGAELSTQRSNQEIQLKVDTELAGYMGIRPMDIAQTVSFALRGAQLSKMKSGSREITVWGQFREEDRKNTNNLNNIMMAGSDGTMVTMNQLVTKHRTETPRVIQRRNGKNFVYAVGSVASKNLNDIHTAMRGLVSNFEMPTGYNVAMGDELRGIEDNQSNFFSLLLMAVLLIFIVMSALFESCLLPLSILTTVPMAFLGVIWLMFLTGTSMDTIAFIGCILMVGVVVNNGIVIVDHINQLRKEGLDRYDAIVQGGLNRLRPVLMTALTTILGAIPLAIGGRIGEPATVSLGMSMIGGLSAGTVLTLFVVPLFYSFIDDLQQWIMRFFGELVSLR